MTRKEIPFEEQFESHHASILAMLQVVVRGGVEVDLTPAQLFDKTHSELKTFFGKEASVVKPPPALFEAKKRIEQQGIYMFDPIYFPDVPFIPEAEYSGWVVRPPQGFWKAVRWRPNQAQAELQGYKGMNALQGSWALIDRSRRPGYNNGEQVFYNDSLTPLLTELREKVDIRIPTTTVPLGSRFGIPPDIQDAYVFPRLIRELGLTEFARTGELRIERPTAMEFNFAGNLRYRHFGQADTAEWLGDICVVPDYGPRMDVVTMYGYRLIGGSAPCGGLRHIALRQSWDSNLTVPYDAIAFRPVIKFSNSN